jgi:hypothetical protein
MGRGELLGNDELCDVIILTKKLPWMVKRWRHLQISPHFWPLPCLHKCLGGVWFRVVWADVQGGVKWCCLVVGTLFAQEFRASVCHFQQFFGWFEFV